MEHPRQLIHSRWVYGCGRWVEVRFGDAIYHLLTCQHLKPWSDPNFLGFAQEKYIISQAEGPGGSLKKRHYFKSHTAKVLHKKRKELPVVGMSNVRSGRKVPSGRMVTILIFQQMSHKYSQESTGFGNLDVRVKLWVEVISH